MGSKYYAVRNGRSSGVYDNWNDCKDQVDGYSGNQYKSFSSLSEAEAYIGSDRAAPQTAYGNSGRYTLEFDGASKGNPGRAGAGAVLWNPDGSVAHRIMEGVGKDTNNAAEYRALNRGLEYAKSQGIDCIQVKGDSKLVCKQVNGDWKTRSENLADLSMKAKNLKSTFKEFDIEHVPRASNSEADALANKAVNLPAGKWVAR